MKNKNERKKLIIDIGNRLRTLRESKNFNVPQMANYLGMEKTSYYRYEKGQSLPRMDMLCEIARKFEISLDWLVMDRGPKRFDGKKSGKKTDNDTQNPDSVKIHDTETREMVNQMETDPRLRHELLSNFYKYKEEKPKPLEPAQG